jgi:hypothetical protein
VTEHPTAFFDIPEDQFPFTIEFLRSDTHEVVHTIVITEPGGMKVPPLRQQLGVPVNVRITRKDGSQTSEASSG